MTAVTAGAAVAAWAVRVRRARAERARWAAASSLAGLGELTAAWLVGKIAWQPCYRGPVDVDEDLAPGLTAALVAVCRAGAVTTASQAGYHGPGARTGTTDAQLAWADGFWPARLVGRLRRAAEGTPYRVVVHVPGGEVLTVTWEDGQPATSCGWSSPRGAYLRAWRDSIGPGAWQDLRAAAQVSVIDPRPGTNTLWAWLERAAREAGERS